MPKLAAKSEKKGYYTRNSYWSGKLSMVDHLVLTILDQILFILKNYLDRLQNKLP